MSQNSYKVDYFTVFFVWFEEKRNILDNKKSSLIILPPCLLPWYRGCSSIYFTFELLIGVLQLPLANADGKIAGFDIKIKNQ